VLIALPSGRPVATTGIASGLAFVGVLVDRLVFVSAGQIIPTTTVGGVVSEGSIAYTPSLVELSIVAAAFAFVAFFYTLAERYLDLREAEVHVGFPLPDLIARARQRLAARGVAEPAEATDQTVGGGT